MSYKRKIFIVKKMHTNKRVKSFVTQEEAEAWIHTTYPNVEDRVKYFVALPKV